MASRLLRNIAVTIGAGLAVGIGKSLASRSTRRAAPVAAPNWEPILSRLETIESRVMRVELTPPVLNAPPPEEIQALSTLVSSQSEDIAALRQDLQKIEMRSAQQVEAFGQKVALLERQVPGHIEAAVNARVAELEHKLRGEFQEIHHRTVDAFADAIEQRVINRITALESNLVEHSRSIVTLREKSLKTDDNLNRLLDAVERLCTRAEAQTQTVNARVAQNPVAESPVETSAVKPVSQAGVPMPNESAAHEGPRPGPESFASHLQEAMEHQVDLEAEPALTAPAPKRDFKSVGVAILGLAFLGLRLIRA